MVGEVQGADDSGGDALEELEVRFLKPETSTVE